MARILVIDDTPGIGEIGMTLLSDRGADLVITDIFMPDHDGIEVARRMRKEFPRVKLIAMSGGGFEGQVDLRPDMERLGAARTIAKPFAPSDLVNVVREVLDA